MAESEVTAAASASPDNLQSGAEEIWRGELVIDGTHPVPANRTKVLRPGTLFKLFGNLTVKNGGRMWVNASSLVIFQSQLSPYRIAVAGTGSLLSFEGSHLTVGDAIFPRYWLDVSVTNGGRLSVADSRFSFPGLISVAGSTLQFNGSSARSAPNAVANGTVQERYGPMLDLNGSRIVSVVSSFHDYPELGSEEMKLRGASEWVAVDTHLDIDLRNQTDPAHNILNVSGTAVLYALGLTFDLAETGSRPLGPAILTSGNFSSAYLFRWSSLQIDDSYSTPMPNATLGFEPETPFPLNSTTRALNDLSLPHPYSTAFLTRLSELHHPRDGTNYRLTDPQGRAVVPLLSDILNHTTMPNPIFAGIYNSSIDHPIGIAAGYPLTLEHYPRCTPKDNWSNRTFTHPGSLTHADLRPVINASKEVTIVTPLNISIRLLNEGDADAKDFEVLLFDDLTNDSALDPKEWIATWTGVDVPAKGEVILQVTHTFTRLPREAHRLVAIADPNSTVKNEPLAFRDDNLARSFVMLRDLPDLLPYEIGTTDESGKRTGILLNGSVATVSFRLENIGDSTSTPTVAGIYDSDPGIGEKPGKNATASVPIGELTPGAGTAASEKIPFNLAGRGSVCVWLDKDLQLRELQEGNNRACATVDVVNVSDLRAEGARITGSVMPTGRVTFFTTVRNVGYWTMERIAVELRDNASGTILNRTSISSLAPNAHKEVGLSWSIPRNETPGIRPIALLVNADRNASPSGYPGHRESDMANNEAYIKADIARLTATLEMPWKDVKVQAGRDIILGGRVLATGSAYPLDNVTVLASFQGSSQIHSTVTETAGTFTLRVQVPQALGKQTFTVRMDGIEGSSVIGTVTVVEAPGAGLPLILGGVALASIAMAL
ncbi:MAG TPA: hypothetical protein VI893_10745, partial [Thermoplasmata archaeon]|nr:hypothetical protein [Thermoplasmata archaeon]